MTTDLLNQCIEFNFLGGVKHLHNNNVAFDFSSGLIASSEDSKMEYLEYLLIC